MAVKDLVVDQDTDILALTETWLRPGNIDDVEIRTLCPSGYRFLHVPMGHSQGGGVGLLFKDILQITVTSPIPLRHTLDLVMSKQDNPLLTEINIFDPVISDHRAVHCNLRVQKPHFTKKKVYYRKLSSLDIESFCEDILTSPLLQDQAVELNALVDQYDNVLRSLLDLYAPLKRRTVTLRPIVLPGISRKWLYRKTSEGG